MMPLRLFYLLLMLIGWAGTLDAQTIRGKLTDAGSEDESPLPGATLRWINTNIGTTANAEGFFTLDGTDLADRRLIAGYLGYRSDTIWVTDTAFLHIRLYPDTAILQPVSVSGHRSSSFISSRLPIKTEVITQTELTKSACCDLAGCFETQATVQAQTTNVLTQTRELRILGLSGVYNQLLFDGLPMFQGLAYTYGISSYPGALVENIFVSKGANSVLQGFEGISGQINVEPKMPDRTDKFLLNAYINSFGEKHVNLNVATPVGSAQKWSTLLALHHVQPAGKIDRDRDGFLDLPLLTRTMAYNRWTYGNDQLPGLFVHIGARYLTEERVGGQTTFDADVDKGGLRAYGQYISLKQPEWYTQTGFRINDFHKVVLRIATYHQDQKAYFGTLVYDAEQTYLYANVQHEIRWKQQHIFQYGFSYRFQHLKEQIGFPNDALSRTYAGIYQTPQRIPGLFAEQAFHWNQDRIVWILGVRADRHQLFGTYLTPRTLIRYNWHEAHTLRASIGTGWRQVNVFSENIPILASSRNLVFQETLQPEHGLNWGINYTVQFGRDNISGTLSADYYQTRFTNQFFPDYDTDPAVAFIRNFKGTSLSNAFQLEANLQIGPTLEWRAAYNFLDVYRREGERRMVLPFTPRDRIMSAISFRPGNRFYFDLNAHGYGRQRLPNTDLLPADLQQPSHSKPYLLVNGQITFTTGQIEVYGGVENIFDFRQYQPLLGWQDPFGPYFDSSFAWGPTRGREAYTGVRWRW